MDKLLFQNEIVERINVSHDCNKVSHAYIFSGAKNSGQIEIAKYLAIKVLATEEIEKQQIEALKHPNVYYITTEKQNISKEQIVEISYEIQTTSMSGKRKIFIIDEANKLSVSAQNSLLKVIEEPDGETIVIFIIENMNQLLPTIVSRCQLIKFKPMSFEIVYNEVKENYSDKLKLKYAMYLSDSEYDELYDCEEFTKYLDVVYDYINYYFNDKSKLLLNLEEICYSFCNNKEKMTNFVNFLIINVSSIINYRNNTGELFDERMLRIIDNVTDDVALDFQNKLFEAYDMLMHNVNIKLAMDKLSMERM